MLVDKSTQPYVTATTVGLFVFHGPPSPGSKHVVLMILMGAPRDKVCVLVQPKSD